MAHVSSKFGESRPEVTALGCARFPPLFATRRRSVQLRVIVPCSTVVDDLNEGQQMGEKKRVHAD